ncbi:acyltransferase domain-containing protein [Pelomonas sp. P7]|uniref:Acyltransferase domain-containing protein n=1 Tax=Pelomonas caseinilytica TaxID=2906763 RepID=A0ABS8XL39_9BURK|nr:acyltransferase domain-containing protein [Pelomonas sp. P7]MCE4540410.1 acyltransferase domain-containing protein [Pelomonas sp. P7]
MGLGLLFPGQGAQHAQMLPWLEGQPEARPALDALARHLGADWRDRLRDPAWRHANAVAQPLLTGIGIAAWQAVAPGLPQPAAVAGYSVGELAAFAAAGVFDADTALNLAAARAQAMDAAAAGRDTGLMGVQGPQARRLAEAAAPLSVAIRIHEEHVIVGGAGPALSAQAETWTALGLRCTRLPIGLASHTPAMAPAARAFAACLQTASLHGASLPVACDFSGTATRNAAALAAALAGQVDHTVRWDECMDSLAERGLRCVLEVGPGTALSAMWRQRHPGIPVRGIEEFQAPQGVRRWVEGQLG